MLCLLQLKPLRPPTEKASSRKGKSVKFSGRLSTPRALLMGHKIDARQYYCLLWGRPSRSFQRLQLQTGDRSDTRRALVVTLVICVYITRKLPNRYNESASEIVIITSLKYFLLNVSHRASLRCHMRYYLHWCTIVTLQERFSSPTNLNATRNIVRGSLLNVDTAPCGGTEGNATPRPCRS